MSHWFFVEQHTRNELDLKTEGFLNQSSNPSSSVTQQETDSEDNTSSAEGKLIHLNSLMWNSF